MTELTQKMLTHCVGRLLIDLPEGTTWEANDSSAQLGGYLGLSVTTGVTEADFKALVARRWSEIEAEEKDLPGLPYNRPEEKRPWKTAQFCHTATTKMRGLIWMASCARTCFMMPRATCGAMVHFSSSVPC